MVSPVCPGCFSIIGKPFSKTNAADNVDLIAVNDAIRNHHIEAVGKRLRGAMTAMITIKSDVKDTSSVLV